MKNVIGLSILLTLSLCLGCYDDKGNYDYHDFNEVTIGNRGFDTAYLLTSYVGYTSDLSGVGIQIGRE